MKKSRAKRIISTIWDKIVIPVFRPSLNETKSDNQSSKGDDSGKDNSDNKGR